VVAIPHDPAPFVSLPAALLPLPGRPEGGYASVVMLAGPGRAAGWYEEREGRAAFGDSDGAALVWVVDAWPTPRPPWLPPDDAEAVRASRELVMVAFANLRPAHPLPLKPRPRFEMGGCLFRLDWVAYFDAAFSPCRVALGPAAADPNGAVTRALIAYLGADLVGVLAPLVGVPEEARVEGSQCAEGSAVR
jgi:hypothetical protein